MAFDMRTFGDPILKTRAALVKDFDGSLGKWSFDENGDTTLVALSGNVVRGGKFEFVKLLGD